MRTPLGEPRLPYYSPEFHLHAATFWLPPKWCRSRLDFGLSFAPGALARISHGPPCTSTRQ